MKKLATRSGLVMALLGFVAAVLLALGVTPYRMYDVDNGSMGRTIPIGSLVVVKSGYKVGEVITFRIHGETVTHRLTAINPDDTITTWGDANPTADPWRASQRDIIGHVVLAPRHLGTILSSLQSMPGFIALVALIVIALYVLCRPTRNSVPPSELTPEPDKVTDSAAA